MRISTTPKALASANALTKPVDGVFSVLGWVENLGQEGALLRGYNGILMMQTGRDLLILDQTEAHARLAQSERGKGPHRISEEESEARRGRMEEARKRRWEK